MFSSIKNLFGKIFKNKIDINIDINNEISKNELINKLIAADVSPDISNKIIQELSQDLGQKIDQKKFKEIILKLILKKSIPQDKIILLIGINGSGKTTLAAKLMHYFKNKKKKPMLIAGDTFRAAAINQLEAWCLKNNVPLFKSDSKDPAAVVFQGCQAFKDSSNDVLIIDTAGRLQTNINLMKELEKVKRSIQKVLPEKEVFTILTVDALLGQNSISQAELFNNAIGVDGVILTKMDGPAKGGTALTIMDKLKIPVIALSYGETEDTLVEFDPEEYVDAIIN